MTVMSRIDIDLNAESELGKFLDRYYYAPLKNEGRFKDFERIHGIDLQKRGIDVIARAEASIAYIDEKASMYYINKDIPTFAFELSYLLGGRPRQGWFLNDDLMTTHYLLLWLKAKETIVSRLRMEDIISAEGMMIGKEDLKRYLSDQGFDTDRLSRECGRLRRKGIQGRVETETKGVYYYVSDPERYSEAPINLIIGKHILSEIALAHYDITTEGFIRI